MTKISVHKKAKITKCVVLKIPLDTLRELLKKEFDVIPKDAPDDAIHIVPCCSHIDGEVQHINVKWEEME